MGFVLILGCAVPTSVATAQITSAFCNLLNRCPDPSGMNYWLSVYASDNGNMQMIVEEMASTSEFQQKFITGNPDPVSILYQKILGRNVDPSNPLMERSICIFQF